MIRDANISDSESVAKIYNFYVEETTATFEEQIVTPHDIAERIKQINIKRYPYIVYEEERKIKGFAYINNWRGRSAYDITLEASIYIDRECTGEGIGRKLYARLILESKKIGIKSLIGVISLPNEASQKLHLQFDFNLVGVFRQAGKKFDKLIDVEFWQLLL